jgi:hypothetical protein
VRRLVDTLQLELALVLALGVGILASGSFGFEAAPAQAAPAPRITLSAPAEVTVGVPAIAKGKIVPARPGRVLLQVWRAHAWSPAAAGKVRQGAFRISFAFQQATPSALRVRATLVQGRRRLGSSAGRKIQIRPLRGAPETTPSPSIPAPAPAIVSGAPAGGEEQPAAGDDEAPPPGEEESPIPPPPNAYWGAWIGPQLTGEPAPWDMNAVSKFEQLVGKQLSIIEFSTPFADCSKSPCSYYSFPWNEFNAIRAHGALPFFSWGSQSTPGGPDQPDFQLADILAGTYDNYIRAWATRAAEWGHPFFLRYDWEMNGDWFTWGEGVNGNQPGEFVAAWRHVHDIFTSVGATNATWVWCPYVNRLNLYASLYPGDDYVDWTCLDGYDWGTNPAAPYGWRTFDNLYATAYAKVTETIAPSKPMAIGEIGASEYGGSKAAWIEEMFEALELRYPKIRALVYFENLGNDMDWPLESSQSAVDAFAAGISDSRFLANVLGNVSASPIPAP